MESGGTSKGCHGPGRVRPFDIRATVRSGGGLIRGALSVVPRDLGRVVCLVALPIKQLQIISQKWLSSSHKHVVEQ